MHPQSGERLKVPNGLPVCGKAQGSRETYHESRWAAVRTSGLLGAG